MRLRGMGDLGAKSPDIYLNYLLKVDFYSALAFLLFNTAAIGATAAAIGATAAAVSVTGAAIAVAVAAVTACGGDNDENSNHDSNDKNRICRMGYVHYKLARTIHLERHCENKSELYYHIESEGGNEARLSAEHNDKISHRGDYDEENNEDYESELT